MRFFMRALLGLSLCAVVVLAGCRRAEVAQGPLVQATLTPTPRSTALPPLPTVLPPGLDENPIQMMIRPESMSQARDAVVRFQDALIAETGLVVEVVLVQRHAEALAALCDSSPTDVNVAWVDAVTYGAAVAQGCGQPALQIERGETRPRAGSAVQIISNAGQNIAGIRALSGRVFCRVGYEDDESWLAPALLLRANGVDPLTAFEAVVDYPDRDALIEAVAAGECAATGLSQDIYDALPNSVRRDLNVVESTPPLPYGVLMFPQSLPLGERLLLTDALLTLALDPESASVMRGVLGQERLARVNQGGFDELASFLGRTGLDLAQMGR